jgi:hypothetical protein
MRDVEGPKASPRRGDLASGKVRRPAPGTAIPKHTGSYLVSGGGQVFGLGRAGSERSHVEDLNDAAAQRRRHVEVCAA